MFRLQMVAVLFILLASLLAIVAGKTSVRYKKEAAWDQDWSDEVTGETTTACPWHSGWNSQLSRHHYYNREVLYRLDVVPCRGIELPGPNTSLHYRASIWSWYSYWHRRVYHWCIATKLPKPGGSMIYEEQDMSYIIRSPGYGQNNYPSQQLSFYRVNCPNHKKVQIRINKIHLQECVRVYGNTKACVDYLKITDGSTTNEFCGNVGENNLFVYGNQVLITFRSSKYNNYQGFYIESHCTDPETSDQAEKSSGCLSVEGYTSKHYTRMPNKEKNRKIVPRKALKILMVFHQSFVQVMNEDSGKVMSVHEAEKNKDILTLAILSERSCVPGYQEMGRKVLKLFPDYMVMEERSILEDEVSMYEK